jgi:hypothetical protein
MIVLEGNNAYFSRDVGPLGRPKQGAVKQSRAIPRHDASASTTFRRGVLSNGLDNRKLIPFNLEAWMLFAGLQD